MVDTFFRLTCSVVLGEGGTMQTNNTGVCLQCFGHTGFAPRSRCVCFPCLHCLGCRLLCQELSEAGPGLHAPPRSKPFRFRYWGSPQRHRFGWVCILCPSQVQAVLVTRCLVSTVVVTYRFPCPCRLVFWEYNGAPSQVCRVSSGELISGCNPPGRCQFSRIPRSLG